MEAATAEPDNPMIAASTTKGATRRLQHIGTDKNHLSSLSREMLSAQSTIAFTAQRYQRGADGGCRPADGSKAEQEIP